MAKIRKANRNKIENYFPIFLLIATLFMGIGYASINNITLDISGNVMVKAQEGVYITDVEIVDNLTSNASNQNSITSGTFLSDTIMLSSNSNQINTTQITYKIYVYNSTDYDVSFYDAIYDTEADSLFYTNPNIVFFIGGYEDGIEFGDVVKSKAEPTFFYVTFKYKNNILPDSNTLKFNINFVFDGKRYYITYLGDVATNSNYPIYVSEGENFEIEVDSELVSTKIHTIDNNQNEIEYSVNYNSLSNTNTILINKENITNDLIIEVNEYNRADYLLGDGRAYIDTEFKINSKSTVEIDFEVLNHYGVVMSLFGSRTDFKTKSIVMFMEVNDDYGKFYTDYSNARLDYDSNGEEYVYHRFDKGRYKLKRTAEKVYVNDELIISNTLKNFECDYSMYVFAINNSGSDQDRTNFNGRVYEFKIYGDGINLDMDLVPAYNEETNKVGMIDLVHHKFYENHQDLNKYPDSHFTYGFE